MATPKDTNPLDFLTADFKRLQRQKSRKTGGVEARVLQNLGFVFDEHYISYRDGALYTEARDPNKLYLMFNLIKPRMNKLLGRLSSMNPSFQASPNRQDPKAHAMAEVVDRLIQALDDKLVQPSKTWEILWWMAVGGTAFEYVPWVPNSAIEPVPQFTEGGELLYIDITTRIPIPESQMQGLIDQGMAFPEQFEVYEEVEEVGEVGSEILGPLNVFLDQSVHSIADLAPDQWVHVAKVRTTGWIEDTFGVRVEPTKNVNIVTSQFHHASDAAGGYFLKDLIPMVQGSSDENDPDMAVVVEAYLPTSKMNPHGRYVCYIPGQQVLHIDDNPYEDIPLVDFHWTPVTTTFWTPGYVESLIPPQRFLNKRMSQLGEQANATLYANLLLGGSLTEKDIPADKPGVVKGGLGESGEPLVQRMSPPEFPSWYLPVVETVTRYFNDIAGGQDLFQDATKLPGQMRGSLAVPMAQEIIDTEWGPLYNHLGERLSLVKQMRLNRVRQFYPPVRTMHYTDRDQKDEVLTFHTDKVLKGSLSFNVKVKRGELIPELRSLREQRIKDRLASPLAILYMDERTGMIDKSKVAADLKFGDTGRETREAQYRKLAQEIVEFLWQAQPVPPVLPFYDHQVMMDELEASMSTMEYLRASPTVQAAFVDRWEQHRQFLMQEAQAQQMAMANGMIQNAVAQATQQAAAQAAADAVTSTQQQMGAQAAQPTDQFVAQANGQGEQAQQDRQGGSQPPRRKRKLTIEDES